MNHKEKNWTDYRFFVDTYNNILNLDLLKYSNLSVAYIDYELDAESGQQETVSSMLNMLTKSKDQKYFVLTYSQLYDNVINRKESKANLFTNVRKADSGYIHKICVKELPLKRMVNLDYNQFILGVKENVDLEDILSDIEYKGKDINLLFKSIEKGSDDYFEIFSKFGSEDYGVEGIWRYRSNPR